MQFQMMEAMAIQKNCTGLVQSMSTTANEVLPQCGVPFECRYIYPYRSAKRIFPSRGKHDLDRCGECNELIVGGRMACS
jgi:hypothetical protein